MALIDAGSPAVNPNQRGAIPVVEPDDIEALINLPEDDPSEGWRVVRTKTAPKKSQDRAYRSLNAHALLIRQGKIVWMNQLGRFDARTRIINGDTAALFVKYLGS